MASVVAVEQAESSARVRFVATIFLGSFLLFLVQPMVARMVIPQLGGAPAVWNSAMLVYQALLLAGYAYAHWLARFAPQRQAQIHLAAFAIAALTLPIGLVAMSPTAASDPFLWVPALLFASIGPLFFVVSAQAPLMQRWYALTERRDPYPLYAASNLGSFAGLIAYPLLVEPWLPLGAQRWLWSGAYALLGLAVLGCALALPKQAAAAAPRRATTKAPSRFDYGKWALLSAIPSGLILSTTLHLTTDIVAMPLLWVIPLGVYLLSFSVAFAARRRGAEMISRAAPVLLLVSALALFPRQSGFAPLSASLAVINLFAVSVALHSRLYDSRPHEEHLTNFYLAMSAGGVLGGLFCALLAPQIFDWTYEHPILLLAAAALLPAAHPLQRLRALWGDAAASAPLTRRGIVLLILLAIAAVTPFVSGAPAALSVAIGGAIVSIALLAIGNRALFAASVAALMLVAGGWTQLALSAADGRMTRSFFGIYTIGQSADARWLLHGTTVHGIENLGSADRQAMPTAYYVERSGVGRAMTVLPHLFGDEARVDVVGLGIGTLACYARPGQRWSFYEIDPVVARIAGDRGNFHFMERCQPDPQVVIGDARLTLGRSAAASSDLLVVDAFSSDSVPMHMLTVEAFEVYRRHLGRDGLLLVHITNRFLDLEPVVAAAATQGGWTARRLNFTPTAAERKDNAAPSIWVAMSQSPASIDRLTAAGGAWQQVRGKPGFRPWTDDHASLLPLIRY